MATTSWSSHPPAVPALASTSTASSLRPLRRSDPPPRPTGPSAALLSEVLAGLGRKPKALPPRAMFDAAGARLFACLTGSQAHYLTRQELALLRAHAPAMGDALGENVQLVDLACGDGARTSVLVEHLRSPARVALADRVSGTAARLASDLGSARPDLPILALDAQDPWAAPLPSFARASRTVACLPSSVIGELDPREAKAALQRLAVECGPRGGLLVGLDLEKDPRALEAAYADAAGLGASFDLNVLARLNRELGATFDLAAFEHRAAYDATKGRVEMQLVSKRWQWAAVHGQWFNFGAGEAVTTLVAYKYTVQWFSSLALAAGWKIELVVTADDRGHALVLLTT